MDTLFGLPAHPLLVHMPIVLIPLAAIGVVVMLIKPAWHQRYRWVVLGMGRDEATAPSSQRRILMIAVSGVAALAAVGSVVTVVQAGHTGSETVWEEFVDGTGD
jgi:hypothetical protein